MALAEETKRITAQFEYTDDDVNRGVQEFLRQMRKIYTFGLCLWRWTSNRSSTDEGLEKDGTSLSQIPTYVTGVPNGTEKVRQSCPMLLPYQSNI